MPLNQPNVYKTLGSTVGPHGYAAGQIDPSVTKTVQAGKQRKHEQEIVAMQQRGASARAGLSATTQREAVKSGEKIAKGRQETSQASDEASMERLSIELAQRDRHNAEQLRTKDADRKFMAAETNKAQEFETRLMRLRNDRSDAVFARDEEMYDKSMKDWKAYLKDKRTFDFHKRMQMIEIVLGIQGMSKDQDTAREKTRIEFERAQDESNKDARLRDGIKSGVARKFEGVAVAPEIINSILSEGHAKGATLRLFSSGDTGAIEGWAAEAGPMGIMEAKLVLNEALLRTGRTIREGLSEETKQISGKTGGAALGVMVRRGEPAMMGPPSPEPSELLRRRIGGALQGLETLSYAKDKKVAGMYANAESILTGASTGSILTAMDESLGPEMTDLKRRSIAALLRKLEAAEQPLYVGDDRGEFEADDAQMGEMLRSIFQGI